MSLPFDTIRTALDADPDHAVIFVGSGATGAADKLVRALTLKDLGQDAVIFVGPYEHHSNDLLWRVSGAKVVRIRPDALGSICLKTLKHELRAHDAAALKIGVSSAASNVTGVLTDLRAFARAVHAHGGWWVADYAAALPVIFRPLEETLRWFWMPHNLRAEAEAAV